MRTYKVIYESLNGALKTATIQARSEKDAIESVLNRYPDCFQIISPDPSTL